MSIFKVTAHDPRVLKWWASQRNHIDFSPPYQRRGRIWSISDKAYLIDSILNGYDIPKLYFADFTFGTSPLNKKRKRYAVIDGKQRLEAIYDFIDGNITLDKSFVYRDDPNTKIAGLGYGDLTANFPEIADIFDNFHLAVMSVVADKPDPINDMFIRLNRSKPLTGAEIRNAMQGPAPKYIREIASHDFFRENIKFSVQRAADQNAAAKILAFEHAGELRETKKVALDRFVSQVRKDKSKGLKLAAIRCIDILDEMSEIFLPTDPLLQSSGIIPIYYWMVRNIKPKHHPHIRSFLSDFDSSRSEQRSQLRKNPSLQKVVRDLSDFDNYNRSTNDVLSHSGRYSILVRRFSTFLRRKKIDPSKFTRTFSPVC